MSHARIATLAAAALLAGAAPAEAHTFGAHGAGLADGIAHPFAGLDHLLAMVAVGLYAAQSGGRALWLLPLSFVAAMAAGAVLGAVAGSLPAVELGIVGSVLVLGALVAFGRRLAAPLGAAVVGLFASFHGFGHGAEMPAAASALAYGAGFVAATATLHAAGVAAGLVLTGGTGRLALRAGGGAIAAIGLALMAG